MTAAHRSIEAAFAELRFAFRIQIQISAVIFEYVENRKASRKRIGESCRIDEAQVVGGRVIPVSYTHLDVYKRQA